MAERTTIPLYGPLGLGYAEHPLIVPHLGVRVAELTDLIQTRPEQPVQPTPEEPDQPGPLIVRMPPEEEHGVVECLHHIDPGDPEPTVIELAEPSLFPIEHQGHILVIEAASFLPRLMFDIAQERAEKWDITVLPIYVRRIK